MEKVTSDQKVDSDEELLNLENELHSLTHYVDDEEELVAQMFASIKGYKLEMMMPPILKEIPLIDLQQLCLHELRGMSQRRILSIINGQEMSGSSSEQDSEDERKPSDGNASSNVCSTKSVLAEAEKALENADEAANLTKMDLLELEMRAKLIKTMLEKQDGTKIKQEPHDIDEETIGNGYVPNIKIKEEPVTPERGRSRSLSRSSSSRSTSSSCSSRSSYSSYSSRSRSSRSRRRRKKRYDSSSTSLDSLDRNKQSSKKKLTKREFEARMKKAKMNRRYRRRKGSDEDSAEDKKKNNRVTSKMEAGKEGNKELEREENLENIEDTSSKLINKENVNKGLEIDEDYKDCEEGEAYEKEEGEQEEEEGEEGEVLEKEEGEIDSNDEGAKNLSGSSRRSSDRSYSRSQSYSSRSRSRTPVRKRRSKKKRRRKHRKYHSRSPQVKEVPKIPNWNTSEESMLPIKRNKEKTDSTQEIGSIECVELNLPSKEERQTISFSISKKLPPGKANPELNDEGLPVQTTEDLINNQVEESCDRTISRLTIKDLTPRDSDIEMSPSKSMEAKGFQKSTLLDESTRCEVSEDFYKGADQLELSEEEIDLEVVEEMDEVSAEALLEDSGSLNQAQQNREMKDSALNEGLSDQSSQIEIIGTIDPKENEGFEATFGEDLAGGGSSWSTRWLKSDKVQKVVSNSKMLSKVRKNIQAKGKKVSNENFSSTLNPEMRDDSQQMPKQVEGPVATYNTTAQSGVIGSMEEYEKMFGIKVKAPTSLPQPKPISKPITEKPPVTLPASLLDSDDEDDEDDAIWSKIMQK